MSTSSGTDRTAFPGNSSGRETPGGWREALVGLVTSRIALIQHEAEGAVRQGVKCLVGVVVAALAGVFAWALLLVAGIGAVAVATSWPWYWIAAGVALLHLLVAGCCVLLVKSSQTPVFPITRNEFLKDREWLQTLTSPRK
jgi:uncharacterized membrane protein YqjE